MQCEFLNSKNNVLQSLVKYGEGTRYKLVNSRGGIKHLRAAVERIAGRRQV